MRRNSSRRQLTGTEGIDFVTCLICSDRRRVISGRHLSKHETDRLTYMEEYRLSRDELIAKAFRVIQSSRRGYKPNNKSQWIVAINKLHSRSESIFAGDLQRSRSHGYLYHQRVWLFGDWDNALKAAGFDPEMMRSLSFWDKSRVTQELNQLRNRRLPVYPRYVMQKHEALFSAAVRHFGSWNKALSSAGIRQVPTRNPLYLLRRLEESLDSGNRLSKALCAEIDYYFGSLARAQHVLRTDKRFLSRWTERKIIRLIVHRHRSGETLSDTDGRHDRLDLE